MDAQQAYPQNDPGSALLADGVPAGLHCPFLGLRLDPDTHFTFPSVNSYCHRVSPMGRVGLEHQATSCLSADHLACPVFTGNQSDWTWKGSLPAQISDRASFFNARKGRLLMALASVLLILAIAVYLGTRFAARPSDPPLQAVSLPTIGQPSPGLLSPSALFTATSPGDTATPPAATDFVLAPVPEFTATATFAPAQSAAVLTTEERGLPVVPAGTSTVGMQILLPVLVQDGSPELASLVQNTPRVSAATAVTSLPSATKVTPQPTSSKKMSPVPTNTPTQPAIPTASSLPPEPPSTVTPMPKPPSTQPPLTTPSPPNSPLPPTFIIPTLQPTLPPTAPPTLSPTDVPTAPVPTVPPPTATDDSTERWPTTPTPVIEKTSVIEKTPTASGWHP